MNREEWLTTAVDYLKSIFQSVGYIVPKVKVSCGFPSTGARSKHIGECWPTKSNLEKINYIFISPSLDDPIEVLDTLVHELAHAVDDCENKHGKEFAEIAKSIGLEGEMKSASAGYDLKVRLKGIAEKLGPYPQSALIKAPVAARSRGIAKAKCNVCGYQVTVIKRFVRFGAPICPIHNKVMDKVGDWTIKNN
jgi:hypothetical protein